MDAGQWFALLFVVSVVLTAFAVAFGRAEWMGAVGAALIIVFGLACVWVAAGISIQLGVR